MAQRRFAALEAELGGRFGDGQAGVLAADDYCALYAVTADGDILTSTARHQLSGGSEEDAQAPSRAGIRRLSPQPQLDPLACHTAVSGDGSFAAVAGPSAEDRECSAVAVVDLRPARFVPGSASSGPCTCSAADPELFAARPGLSILQLAWHPGSSRHLAVLSSDSTLRLFCLDDLSLAEQTFQLQPGGRHLGFAEEGAEQAVAFAFGRGGLWRSFAVYILTGSGSVFLLCPVAPFGCLVPRPQAAQLQAAGADSPTTATWLQQALGDAAAAAAAAATPDTGGRGPSVAVVQPHALAEHVPQLQGPLPVSSPSGGAGGLAELQPAGATGCSLALAWCSDECCVLCVATAEGLVGWHLLTHEPAPAWARAAPSCVAAAGRITAVDSQVPRGEGCEASMLLLAAVQLQAAGSGEPQGLRLLLDRCQPARLFCLQRRAAHLLSAPWVPQLAHQLSTGGEGLRLDVDSTGVERLWAAAAGGAHAVGAAVVGDALTGTALALALSDGSLRCLQASGSPHSPLPRIAKDGAGERAAEEAEAAVAAKYGDLLRGPAAEAPATARLGAGDAQGQKLLSDAIATLNQGHVQFAHRAHDKLLKELEQAGAAAGVQRARLEALQQAAAGLEGCSEALQERLQRAGSWNDNLHARVKLLVELHAALPQPPSDAEARLRSKQLPALEREVAQLADTLKGLRKRAAAAADAPEPAQPAAPLPPAQAHQLRQALAAQSDTIGTAQRLAADAEGRLQAAGVGGEN